MFTFLSFCNSVCTLMLSDWYSLESHYNNLNKRKKPVTKPERWTDPRGILKVVVAWLCFSKVRLESKMGTSFNIKAKRLLATWFSNMSKNNGGKMRTTLIPVHWSSLVKVGDTDTDGANILLCNVRNICWQLYSLLQWFSNTQTCIYTIATPSEVFR